METKKAIGDDRTTPVITEERFQSTWIQSLPTRAF